MSATHEHLSDTAANTISEVVFGEDVAMTRSGREITLHAPGPARGGRRVIGRYASTAAAWEALDNLDAPFTDVSQVA